MRFMPLRFPPEVHAQVAALIPVVKADEGFAAARVTQAFVLRYALLEGLHVLREKYKDQLAKG